MIKPMEASDWNPSKVQFPVGMQPKIDGVRGMHLSTGGLTGRSLKAHGNNYTTAFYSHVAFRGFDGEFAAEAETHPSLCRLTSSAIGTHTGAPWLMWHLFDYIPPGLEDWIYIDRYQALERLLHEFQYEEPELAAHLKLVPMTIVNNMDELEALDAKHLDAGYEGSILRKLNGLYKEGRSTAVEGGLNRIKRFTEEEFLITGIEEGRENNNVATINERGRTERSTHAENMTPNGMVGALLGTDIKSGKPIKVSAGSIPHSLRALYFKQPGLILGQIGKYKSFPKGVKDKPRFPTFQSLKIPSDIGA